MATLSRDLRRQLEKTVAEARTIAEEGAEQSLHRLAVELARPHDALTEDDKKLRVSLRAHAKQLGDRLDHRPTHLRQAVAYEHWHRLLFARFLIENDILLHPEHDVALSLAEVKEIALEQGREWVEVAADYAQRMLLRRVFQPDDPALRVSLPPEKRLQLEEKLNSLPKEVFLADDSLGWVYQFWQRDEKERVNQSETKIGADELPAVTQLFTEDYMVLFLLENTLGAWWTAKRRADGKDPRLPGYGWTYLRLNEDGSPAAGAFDTWSRSARELRVLDPCMGSGHFLVFALPILARMRMEEEGLDPKEAVVAVLRDNLFGLEIDGRCAQIAAFNLALAAWRFAGLHFSLPEMNLACSGLGINASEADWVRLAGEDGLGREAMSRLYGLFKDAPTLGSLIDPLRLQATLYSSSAERMLPLIEQALQCEQSDEARELAIAAQGVLAAFRILSSRFTLAVTNVPYLGRWRQGDKLAEYCKTFYSDSKADLSACFIDRCIRLLSHGGSTAVVSKQEPLFLGQYQHQRVRLLKGTTWNFVAKLGPRAFEAISGERVNIALLSLTEGAPGVDHIFFGVDTSKEKTPPQKAGALRTVSGIVVKQSDQLKNPDSRVIFEGQPDGLLLKDYVSALAGHLVGDSIRFERAFWEVPAVTDDWEFLQSTVEETCFHGGKSGIILWEKEQGQMYRLAQSVRHLNHVAQNWLRGKPNWGKRGVIVSEMGDLPVTLYLGQIYDCNCCALVPQRESDLAALWAYCSSEQFNRNVRRLDQNLKVHPRTLIKVPFDVEHWRTVAKSMYPHGLPAPGSTDPTQWIFHGDPKASDHPLQVAVARLVGYRWPRQTGSSFLDCPALDSCRLESHIEVDGIVTLSALAGKASAADRLRGLLSTAYGVDWSAAKLAGLVEDAESLEVWLRDKFFDEHCQIFGQRPFIWHVWDGLKDGFHALVNYHKLAGPNGEGRQTLERLIYTSLGDWIARQRDEVSSGVEGADGRLTYALHLKGELERVLDGEKPYDLFVRWKPLEQQPIGWNPDLHDGVRLNIRPWIADAKVYRGVKPGILRVTPNIKYGKDRGKEPACDSKEFPWFKDSPDRDNDLHLTLEEKRKARGLT